jgi:hypothetical protein
MRDRADVALVSPGVRPPLTQLAFRVDQSPVPGGEVGTRVLGAGHRRGAGSDVAAVAATGVSPKGGKAPPSCARPKVRARRDSNPKPSDP